jgi:hypothetical protein
MYAAAMTDESVPEKQNEITLLLARTPVLAGACELDLLMFLYRHPRTLLANEQLAVFVGYDMTQIAKAIETFIEAGLVEKTQNSMHAARMYLLLLEAPHMGGLRALLDLASTQKGRRQILQILVPKRSNPPADVPRAKRGLRVIA